MNKDAIKVTSPIYLLRTVGACWKCGANQEVIALATRQLEEPGFDIPMQQGDEPAILQKIENLPAAVLEHILRIHPSFEKRASKQGGSVYYMNTCTCGAHFGDFFLHSEPGGAFFPQDEDEARRITIEEMPFTGTFDFDCSYAIGNGAFIFEHARKTP